ncbi:MAG: hypothetical protein MI685_02620 [Chlorobiales bacterium]|nr:hypothetical protein [Chlorobiales bacterium]
MEKFIRTSVERLKKRTGDAWHKECSCQLEILDIEKEKAVMLSRLAIA